MIRFVCKLSYLIRSVSYAMRHALGALRSALHCSLFTVHCLLFTVYCSLVTESFAQTPDDRYAILIAGLGGSPAHKEKFHQYLYDVRKSLIERFEFEEAKILVLADALSDKEPFIDDISNAETIRQRFSEVANATTAESDVYVILFGHGSFDGKNAVLNIPRRDLKDTDYAEMLNSLNARQLVFVNTSSCSGPFIEQISAPGRVIITATRSGRERNETAFPRFLVEALENPSSDLDKNGQISVLEVFQSAAGLTAKWYEEENHLATEHPLLEDNGDKQGFQSDELLDKGEGALAATIYLTRPSLVAVTAAADGDSVLIGLYQEKQKIENQIMALRMEKSQMPEPDYLARLEPLFVRLAVINDKLDKVEDESRQ